MSIVQSQQALIEALQELYADAVTGLYEPSEVTGLTTTEEVPEGIGVVVHYPIMIIMDRVKEITFFRAKNIVAEGQIATGLMVTSDEETMLTRVLKEAVRKVFRSVASASKLVENPNPIDESPTINTYTDQEAFEKGELWQVVDGETTTLFRCITDTTTAPSTDSLDWLEIEDGVSSRVYFIMLLNAYWDMNFMESLDDALFNAIVAYIVREWYELAGEDKEVAKWQYKYEEYVSDARGATFRRTRAITRRCSPI